MNKVPVVCQLWEESEAGWGCRPDGWTVHRTEADRVAFVKEYWDRQPKGPAPDEYTRTCGNPFLMDLNENDKLYEALIKSKNGVWGEGNRPPKV
jgi:hypothetical protein